MKKIRDAVHGEIIIQKEYFKTIIDTAEFQRLRHIEQTAIRSIYPSARHDRFIHSLGVFYIGQKLVEHLHKFVIEIEKDDDVKKIERSYLLACLLHDIGHAPFSHTFEDYFGTQATLAEKLNKCINIVKEEKIKNPKNHEYTSAIISVTRFFEQIKCLGGDPEWVARMITGLKYEDDENSLIDCYIELLHGEVIDADRIDYACRDVWASGYATAQFDVSRLINSVVLTNRYSSPTWKIYYNSGAVNEIESLMKIREFQNRHVISRS